ncbi:hypothetical protein HE1_01025 [Holospora elegans E1]|uniref:Uncharacterized protein n=1 Tax=Holospora elegans E1 TaxID=1427503 RepID=A0A023E0T8_9PROT|nr:hypothetical protein HE1_01025 [Holospora elegans E1]
MKLIDSLFKRLDLCSINYMHYLLPTTVRYIPGYHILECTDLTFNFPHYQFFRYSFNAFKEIFVYLYNFSYFISFLLIFQILHGIFYFFYSFFNFRRGCLFRPFVFYFLQTIFNFLSSFSFYPFYSYNNSYNILSFFIY